MDVEASSLTQPVSMTTATLSCQRMAELLPFLERFASTGNLLKQS